MNVEILAPLATPRLSGERLRQSHFAALHELHCDPVFMRHLGGVKSEFQTQEYLDRNLAHWREKGFGIWLLRFAGTGELVGRAGLRTLEVEGTPEVEVGYGLRPKFWGRGLATEAALECVRIARSLGLWTIIATTYADNEASKRVMERIGLRFDREVHLCDMNLEMFRGQLDSPSNPRLEQTLADARAAQPPSR